ncbi:MAG: hypothetical protein ACNA8W_25840, partial [Bradymonadaceae bacterium]
MHALYGALFAASARTLLGEFEVTESTRAKLNDVRKQVEEISELVDDLSPTHPGSWARFVGRYMERTFDTYREFEHCRDWLLAHGYSVLRSDLDPFFTEILDQVSSKIVFKDHYYTFHECTLEGGVKLCYTRSPEEHRRTVAVYFRHEIDGEEAAIEAMASLFWQGRRAILADAASGITLSDFSLHDHQY